jgi:hypothetical protein
MLCYCLLDAFQRRETVSQGRFVWSTGRSDMSIEQSPPLCVQIPQTSVVSTIMIMARPTLQYPQSI